MKRRMPFDIEFLLESLLGSPKIDLLKESPDAVQGADARGNMLLHFQGDNIAFIASKNWSIIKPKGTHNGIITKVEKCGRENDQGLDILDRDGIEVDDHANFIEDLFVNKNSNLNDLISDYVDDGDNEDKNFRSDYPWLITGRIWVDKKIISFWNDQQEVIRNWSIIEKMFQNFEHRLTPLKNYKIDWIEREDEKTPMTPASSISPKPKKEFDYENVPETEEGGQFNFFARLFKNPIYLDKLSTEQLKKIRDKVHVLDPQVKAQVMKVVGNDLVNKAGEIADKLGMSVAQFRSIWTMDEARLNEDPDSVLITKDKMRTLKQRGHDLSHVMSSKGGPIWHDSPDATVFLIELKNGLILYQEMEDGVRLTHPDMGAWVMGYLANPSNFEIKKAKKAGVSVCAKGDPQDDSPGTDFGTLVVMQSKNKNELDRDLNIIGDSLSLHGDVSRESNKFIQGRFWEKTKIISFWSNKNLIVKNFNHVEEFLTGMGIRKEGALYQFLDSEYIYTYNELQGKSVKVRTDAEMKQLMKIQHLDPRAKKKLAAMQNGLTQKAPVGWDFQAQRDAAMPALENIKLGDLLKETPDRITLSSDNKSELDRFGLDSKSIAGAHWSNPDTVIFFSDISEKRVLWSSAEEIQIGAQGYENRKNHASVLRQIAYFRRYPDQFVIITDSFGGFSLTSKPNANLLKIWFKRGGVHGIGFASKEDFSAYLAMADWSSLIATSSLPKNLIVGRYWKRGKVISFWQPKDLVLKNFSTIDLLLNVLKMNKVDVAYEFIDNRKVFSYDKLFKNDSTDDKLSNKEVKDLLKKQHTDPSAKKKLKDLGYYDQNSSKKGTGGFPHKAAKDAAMPALQEMIKKFNIST